MFVVTISTFLMTNLTKDKSYEKAIIYFNFYFVNKKRF